MSMHRVVAKVLTLVVLALLASASTVPAQEQGPVVLSIADVKDRQAVEREIAQAQAKGLPVQPLIAKAHEGVVKRASGSAIRAAIASQAERLEQARALLAPSPSVAEIVSGAEALRLGVSPSMLKEIRAKVPMESVVIAIDVLSELVARKVDAKQALKQMTDLVARGASSAHIAGLGASVQADVASGLAPDAALEVRARGVMSLLPSPAAQAAGAPRGKSP
jgi:hypothetical protein